MRSVYLEICEIKTQERAQEIIKLIEDRFDDLPEEVNVCLSVYYKREKQQNPIINKQNQIP